MLPRSPAPPTRSARRVAIMPERQAKQAALDASGKPVASFYTTTLTYELR